MTALVRGKNSRALEPSAQRAVSITPWHCHGRTGTSLAVSGAGAHVNA
jgi:hypothetical protein